MADKKDKNREEGVLMEDLDKKLDLVLDGHKALDKKIDKLDDNWEGRFNNVDQKLDEVIREVKDIRKDLEKVVYRHELKAVEERVNALEEKIGIDN